MDLFRPQYLLVSLVPAVDCMLALPVMVGNRH